MFAVSEVYLVKIGAVRPEITQRNIIPMSVILSSQAFIIWSGSFGPHAGLPMQGLAQGTYGG